MRATKDASDTIAEAWSKDIRECARLEVLCEKLTKELAAERARRIKAEEVVDSAMGHFKEDSDWWAFNTWEKAKEYRAQYPRVEKELK